MSATDMPPPTPAVKLSDSASRRSVAPNGSVPARNGDAHESPPTPEQVCDLARRVREAIREDARKAVAAGERAIEGLAPPDGVEIRLRRDSKVVKRLRALRDENRSG